MQQDPDYLCRVQGLLLVMLYLTCGHRFLLTFGTYSLIIISWTILGHYVFYAMESWNRVKWHRMCVFGLESWTWVLEWILGLEPWREVLDWNRKLVSDKAT